MRLELTDAQQERQAAYRTFVDREVKPLANQIDQRETTPPALIQLLGDEGYLGAALPQKWGGGGVDAITYGLLNEEIGRGCSSIRSLLTVHNMSSQALARWGSKDQKQAWLPRLTRGEAIMAFGLSEPKVGSDAKSVQTSAEIDGDAYVLNGQKKWITYGQIANLYLIFAQCEGKPTAFLVERESEGLTVEPICGLLGTRGSMVAKLTMRNCRIPKHNIVGRPGMGLAYVAGVALDHGRYSVAWGCVGILQACLDDSLSYTSDRHQFGEPLRSFQLIQQMVTDIATNARAARLLCLQAGYLRDQKHPRAIMETSIAKYFAARAAAQAATDTVQMHGANGCSADYSAQRYLRDAKIMEIIEGSNQMHQVNIADYAYQTQ